MSYWEAQRAASKAADNEDPALSGSGRSMPLSGFMLHGVSHVGILGSPGDVVDLETDGRAYMWSNGAVTIYSPNPDVPWMILPAHRIVGIVGKEHG